MSTATWWQTNVNWAPKLAVFESFSIRAHVSPVFLCILYSSSILRHYLVTVDNNFIFFLYTIHGAPSRCLSIVG